MLKGGFFPAWIHLRGAGLGHLADLCAVYPKSISFYVVGCGSGRIKRIRFQRYSLVGDDGEIIEITRY